MTQISSQTVGLAMGRPVAAISFIAGVASATALSDAPYPRPGSTPEQIRRYFSDNAGPARVSIAGQLISAGALCVFSGAIIKRARNAESGFGPIQTTAAAGGLLSVATLTASALTSLRLSRGDAIDPTLATRLHHRAFVAGGPLHGPGIGLVMAALGVLGRRTNSLPRALTVASLATAVSGLLAPAALSVKPVVWLIPASRFPGLLISAIAGAMWMRQAQA
jgi:hypothetical protein